MPIALAPNPCPHANGRHDQQSRIMKTEREHCSPFDHIGVEWKFPNDAIYRQALVRSVLGGNRHDNYMD